MQSIISIIRQSWKFYRKQRVLNDVIGWMLLIPITLLVWLSILSAEDFTSHPLNAQLQLSEASFSTVLFLANILLSLWIIWGLACVLLIGTKLIKSPAGRTRTSFAAIRKQASSHIIPLFLTDILRDCISILWLLILIIPTMLYQEYAPVMVPELVLIVISVLLAVPAILYRIRTTLYSVAVVCEGKQYLKGLKHSQNVIDGHTAPVLLQLIGISVLIFILPFFITVVATEGLGAIDSAYLPVGCLMGGAVFSLGLTIFMLSLIVLYKNVKALPKR